MKKFQFYLLFSFFCFTLIGIAAAQPAGNMDLSTAMQDFSRMSDGQKSQVLGGMGIPSANSINWASLGGNILFSSIGFIAFAYGKKNEFFKTMTIGIVMMVYPYVVSNTIAMYAIGVGLCGALYYFRD